MTPSMVSRALNPNGKVSEEKRERVLRAAEKYNFMPNRMASRLSGMVIKIGIIINTHFKPIEEDMIAGFSEAYDELKDYKIEYELFSAGGAEDIRDLLVKFKNYDGVIISGCGGEINSEYFSGIKNLVQVQSANENIDYLFSSEHDTELASSMAAELLAKFLSFSKRKNVALFTGNINSKVHRCAKKAFIDAATQYGLNIADCVDMRDDEEYLRSVLPGVFDGGNIDGVYITSGISLPLCEYVKQKKLNIPLITFDVYKELNEYIKDGTVAATMFQNAKGQAKTAFEKLVLYIINNTLSEKRFFTSVKPVIKSNLKLYE